jgi:hypothetical protein
VFHLFLPPVKFGKNLLRIHHVCLSLLFNLQALEIPQPLSKLLLYLPLLLLHLVIQESVFDLLTHTVVECSSISFVVVKSQLDHLVLFVQISIDSPNVVVQVDREGLILRLLMCDLSIPLNMILVIYFLSDPVFELGILFVE